MRREPLVAVALAMWLMLLVPWLGLSVVFAAGTANCSSNDTNRWLSQQSATTAQRHGAKAVFEVWNLPQCTQPNPLLEISGSFVFTNITPTDGGFNDILQIGAGNCRSPVCPGGMQYYVGFGLTHTTPGCAGFQDSSPVVMGSGTWTSAQHTYTVRHESNVWRVYVDTSQKWVDLGEGAVCWTPRSAKWFGESLDFGDQIGGTATDHLTVSATKYMTSEGGAWVNTSFNASQACNDKPSNNPFWCDVTGAQSFDIWTDR